MVSLRAGSGGRQGARSSSPAWARETAAALEPFSRAGGYVNYEPDGGPQSAGPAYGQAYDRLRAVKGRYDPQNVFRRNQNIEPLP